MCCNDVANNTMVRATHWRYGHGMRDGQANHAVIASFEEFLDDGTGLGLLEGLKIRFRENGPRGLSKCLHLRRGCGDRRSREHGFGGGRKGGSAEDGRCGGLELEVTAACTDVIRAKGSPEQCCRCSNAGRPVRGHSRPRGSHGRCLPGDSAPPERLFESAVLRPLPHLGATHFCLRVRACPDFSRTAGSCTNTAAPSREVART